MCLYNLYTNKEVIDIKFQDQVINGIAVSNDSKQIYTASEDGKIRELYYRTVLDSERSEECIGFSILQWCFCFSVITFSGRRSAPIVSYDSPKDRWRIGSRR